LKQINFITGGPFQRGPGAIAPVAPLIRPCPRDVSHGIPIEVAFPWTSLAIQFRLVVNEVSA